jgi:hypothetical protein
MSDEIDESKQTEPAGIWRKAREAIGNTGIRIETEKGLKGALLGVADAYGRAKKQKEQARLLELYSTWCIRDTWLIYSEAVPLSVGIAPRDMMVFDYLNPNPWELARNCGGHSLSVTNLPEKPERWRVEPREWVRWLMEKRQPVPRELIDVVLPKPNQAEPQKRTIRATMSREEKKRDRIKALKAFIDDVGQRARSKGVDWDLQSIPVTKAEFLVVFYQQYPQIEEISEDSFDRDIAEIGLRFKPGIKRNVNNMLAVLYIPVKPPRNTS